ncbi:MAG: DHH family phosphoesterase [Clostridia bacterium]|nr:DHH family phosphoesterase [Clostridia bacterium]
MKKRLQTIFIPLCAALVLQCLVLLIFRPFSWLSVIAVIMGIIGLAAAYFIASVRTAEIETELDDVFRQNTSAAARIVESIALPALLFDSNGRIIWKNESFNAIYDGNDLKKLLPSFDMENPEQARMYEHGGRSFQIMSMPVKRSHSGARKLTFQYWIDRTEALHYSRLYEEQMPTVALIYVDNYEELNADEQFRRSGVMGEIERRIAEFVVSIDGVYRKYDSAHFMVVFEAKYLPELEKQRFSMLDGIREIKTGTEQSVTLSISVGVANRIQQSDESARQGMELALGRGGDQVVVKRGTSYNFYGGKKQVTTKQSRVKMRLFAKALRQLMENSDQVFIMGHRNPDMDCLGAALGLMRCAAVAGCKAYFVLNENNPMVEDTIRDMGENSMYRDSVKTVEQAIQLLRTSSAVIVVDTQRASSVEAPELYEKASKTVIIDHHRRPVDALTGSTLTCFEAGASSTCEMVTEVLQYFGDKVRPTSFECGALLAGITLDTKKFSFNTGARTFEAASYLRRHGADTSAVKLLFQDDMQTYRNRSKVVESALIMDHGIAISTCPSDTPNPSLIAAQAADALVGIKGIQASFVLADDNGVIMISGRSLGDINVQIILEKLGGGGHLTVAGAQLRDKDMDGAVAELTNSINEYLKEAGIQ